MAYKTCCSQAIKWDDPALGPLFQYKSTSTSPSPQSSGTSGSDSQGGAKLWIILGCVLGGVALLTIILSIAWVVVRRDRARRNQSTGSEPSELLGHDAKTELPGRSRGKPTASRLMSELPKWPEELNSDRKAELDGEHKMELTGSPASAHRFEMPGTPGRQSATARRGRPRPTLRSELPVDWERHAPRALSARCSEQKCSVSTAQEADSGAQHRRYV